MAGHSHWAGIKHKKAIIDSKRGKLWSKLSKAIIVAAKHGGGDPDSNLRLRYAIDDAKAGNMPSDTIHRAIKKGTGELEGGNVEEVVYEGYAPGGVAVLCEVLTDNRNRTAPEIRKLFEVHDGKLGGSGCVAWMFDRKGLFFVSASAASEERLLEIALDSGADDVRRVDDRFEIVCDPAVYGQVAAALKAHAIQPESSQIVRIPNSTIDLDPDTARKVLDLLEKLDDHDDVQSVSANFNVTPETLAAIGRG
jgi:YebC/PmpR family DNA-binding regulatory protein